MGGIAVSSMRVKPLNDAMILNGRDKIESNNHHSNHSNHSSKSNTYNNNSNSSNCNPLSKNNSSNMLQRNRSSKMIITSDDIFKLLMPSYYTTKPVTIYDIEIAKLIIQYIMDDSAPGYQLVKDECVSCLIFVYDTFYKRFADFIPNIKSIFIASFKSQFDDLTKFLNILLIYPNDKNIDMKTYYKDLADTMSKKGFKPIDYGVAGYCFLYALEQALGKEIFTHDIRLVFERILSRALISIIPYVSINNIKYEQAFKDNKIKENKVAKQRSNESSAVIALENYD
uniref:Uncharacterized protein n=1 Tax=Chromulina nebulosa TaxID=96789 RepID=A0A7S0XCD4_9STRA|mmetsp:Transcript_3091/g.2737  ORF Transcript_3091/g.2737 Transcript_3091/m.2737 type:complete len:284 (+) Transcript_3091:66-917(+)